MNMERMQLKAAPEVMLPRDQEPEANDLMKTVMENMNQKDRERMADFLRGVQFAQMMNAGRATAGMPGV